MRNIEICETMERLGWTKTVCCFFKQTSKGKLLLSVSGTDSKMINLVLINGFNREKIRSFRTLTNAVKYLESEIT